MADLYSKARMAYWDANLDGRDDLSVVRLDSAIRAAARFELLALLDSSKRHETPAVIYSRIHKRLMQLQDEQKSAS